MRAALTSLASLAMICAGCAGPAQPAGPLAACSDASVSQLGGEDLAVTPSGLLVSFDDRRGGARGSIRLRRAGGEAPGLLSEDLTQGFPQRFHPHGLGVVEVSGVLWVMVVNHPNGWDAPESTVEIYRQTDGGLLDHDRTVVLEGYPRLNDVTPISATTFYATHESAAERGSLSETLQFILRRGDGSLVFHDGSRAVEAATDFGFANSVERTADGRLAVSDSVRREVRILGGDLSTGHLEEAGVVRLGGGPDNLTLQDDGSLLVVTHDRLRDYARYAAEGEGASPWSIWRLSLPASDWRAEPVMSSDGEDYPAMSVAWREDDGQYLLGSIFGRSAACTPTG